MAPHGRFGSGVGFAGLSPLFSWGFAQCETKRVVSGLSLGKRRASPPSIPQQYEGTRSIPMERISRKLEETRNQNVDYGFRVQTVQKTEPSSPTPHATLAFL